MSKKMISLAMAVAFMAMTATVTMAEDCTISAMSGDTITMDCGAGAANFAAGADITVDKAKCKVSSVSGSTVTADCKGQTCPAPGATAKVSAKKKKAIEGC